jgi:hypothetical protein
MAEPSASAVLAFLVAAPVAAPAAVELLLPMGSVRSKNYGNGCRRRRQLL